MNFLEILQIGEELLAAYNAAQADGSLAQLKAAGGVLEGELASNPNLAALVAKVEALFPHLVAPKA